MLSSWGSSSVSCLDMCWIPPWSFATTKVGSDYQNPMFHDHSKHLDIKYHFIRDMVQRGAIRLHHIGTHEQVIDILTKPLEKIKFLAFREWLEVMERPSYECPVWDGHWVLGAPGGLGYFLERWATIGWVVQPSPSGLLCTWWVVQPSLVIPLGDM